MASFNIVVKYIFYVVITLGAGLTVERLTRIKHWKLGLPLALTDVYNVSSRLKFEDFKTILRKNYSKCLTNPGKPFCLTTAHKSLEIFQADQSHNAEVFQSRFKNLTAGLQVHTNRMYLLLVDFVKLMEDNNVKVMLAEPSILFCLLSDKKKNNMLLKGFNPTRLLGSRNIITVGVLSEDSVKLEGTNLTLEALSTGFKLEKVRRWIGSGTDKSLKSVHYIFIQQDIAVHVVVFHPRESYWWHAGMDAEKAVRKNLLFVEDGMFENFFPVPLRLDGVSTNGTFVPHDIRYFMLQIGSSNIVKCGNVSSSLEVSKHTSLTMDELNNRAEVALKELKALFAPQLVLFWLWSDTLLGWSSKCDIFHNSTTLEVAVMHRSIEGLDLDSLIADNDNLEVSNYTDSTLPFQYRIMCHGLEINISILHKDNNSLRMERNDGSENFNLTYPKFTLCSTSLYNLKTQVPCIPEDVLKVDYKLNDKLKV